MVIGLVIVPATNNPSNFVYALNGAYYYAPASSDSTLTRNVYGVYGYGQYPETGNHFWWTFLSYAGGNETATRHGFSVK